MRPPDVEAALVALLGAAAPAATRVPDVRPAAFIRVSRAGGSRRDIARSDSTVLVECFAPTSRGAFALAADAWGLLDGAAHSMVGGVWVGSVSADDPAPLDHPDYLTHHRYQFLASLRVGLAEGEA